MFCDNYMTLTNNNNIYKCLCLEATHIVLNIPGQLYTDNNFHYFTISPNLHKIIIVFGCFVIITERVGSVLGCILDCL